MLGASQLYQNSVTASNGGAIVLTAGGNAPLGTANSLTAASGKIDLGQSGFFLPTSGSAGLYSVIQAGYNPGKPAWSGSTGITSSLAASNPSSYAVGYGTASVGNTTEIILATTLPGDGGMTGTVANSDMALVFGAPATFALQPANPTWSQGNFVYQSTIGNADRQAVKQHLGQTLTFPPSGGGSKAAAPAGSVSPATSGPAEEVDYNSSTGSLSLVVGRTSDLDAFTVFLRTRRARPNPCLCCGKPWWPATRCNGASRTTATPPRPCSPAPTPGRSGPGLDGYRIRQCRQRHNEQHGQQHVRGRDLLRLELQPDECDGGHRAGTWQRGPLGGGVVGGIAVFWRRRRRAGSSRGVAERGVGNPWPGGARACSTRLLRFSKSVFFPGGVVENASHNFDLVGRVEAVGGTVDAVGG